MRLTRGIWAVTSPSTCSSFFYNRERGRTYEHRAPSDRDCARMRIPEMALPHSVSTQLKAVAELRWRMFVNGLRGRRGKTEFASRMLISSVFAVGGVAGFLVASFFSYLLV